MSTRKTASDRPRIHVALIVFGLAVAFVLIVLAVRTSSTSVDPYRANTATPLVGEVIQVSIRNGCGVSSLAGEMTQYLRQHGFDVVEVGNHTSFDQEQTVVYDRIGDLESAQKLAAAVGLPADRVVQDIDPEEYLDATIIIGKDYVTLTPFRTRQPKQ